MGIQDAAHIRFAPTVLNTDVDGSRHLAERELSDAALLFAGKLDAVRASELISK
ncbi:hypothetical protein [Paenarthrobacter sp. CC6]|uniref:hypothetical protein n=1 Tax=Paenarthrobacter sp. CC6 TaxID=3029184 RepID=UPI00339D2C78